jgi:hypothetical protein
LDFRIPRRQHGHGQKPKLATSAVIKTGRNRVSALSTSASSGFMPLLEV